MAIANEPTASTPTLFARKATGLVRESSVWNASAFNILNVTIAYAILYPALFIWQFPGASLLLGGIIGVAAFIPLGLCYALVVAAMPRAGSDYVFVSRVFHPAVGFVVAVVFMVWVTFWSGLGINLFLTLGLAPQLAVLGHPAAQTWLTVHSHIYILGILILLALGGLTAFSTKQAMRVLTGLVLIGMIGTVITAIVLLVTGHGSFVSAFNRYAAPYSHKPDTYHAVLAAASKAGYNAGHPFDFKATLGLVPWAATSFLYVAGQAAIGGEIKRPARNSFMAIYITLGSMLALVLFVFLGLDGAVGQRFVGAAGYVSANVPKAWPLPNSPNYNFLATISVSSSAVRWIMSIAFAVWYLPGPILNYIFISRYMVATSMDGVVPERLGRVNPRTHTPLLAITIGLVLSIVSLIVLTSDGTILTILSAVLGELVGGYLLLSLACVFFPFLRKTRQSYRASPANISVAGIPLITITGALSSIILILIGWRFWEDGAYGLNATWSKIVTFGLPALAVLIYYARRWFLSTRSEDLDLAFKEIPPA
jgi:amino acid transporter